MKFPPVSTWILMVSTLLCAAPAGQAALIGYYAFEEGTGTATEDDGTGTDADGTLANGAGFTGPSPYPGSNFALNLDGTNDFVDVANQSKYSLTGAMTLAAWVYVDTFNSGRIVTKGGAGSNRGWSLNIEFALNNSPQASFQIATGASTLETVETPLSMVLPTGTWMHLAGVFTPNTASNGSLSIYVNGVLANSVATTRTTQRNSTVDVGIGARNDGTVPFDGRIDEVRIYDEALSADAIVALAVPEPNVGGLLLLASLGLLALGARRRFLISSRTD